MRVIGEPRRDRDGADAQLGGGERRAGQAAQQTGVRTLQRSPLARFDREDLTAQVARPAAGVEVLASVEVVDTARRAMARHRVSFIEPPQHRLALSDLLLHHPLAQPPATTKLADIIDHLLPTTTVFGELQDGDVVRLDGDTLYADERVLAKGTPQAEEEPLIDYDPAEEEATTGRPAKATRRRSSPAPARWSTASRRSARSASRWWRRT